MRCPVSQSNLTSDFLFARVRSHNSALRGLSLLLISCWLLGVTVPAVRACELCAVYSADNARQGSAQGFLVTIQEPYTESRSSLFNGQPLQFADDHYVNTSITHIVPGYNFSDRFGVSLNIPLVYRSFKRTGTEIQDLVIPGFGTLLTPNAVTEQGHVSGLGDIALIGRATVFKKAEMNYSVALNLLAGVKFPTGDTDRLRDLAFQAQRYYDYFSQFSSVHTHDVTGQPSSGVHQSDLTLGSGSFDGILGLTANARWRRWFFNTALQYYLRTEGESAYQYGDMLMWSGGPGTYLLMNKAYTLSVQGLGYYETKARDRLRGEISNHTGMTIWYAGPQLTFTWHANLSAQAAVDIPLQTTENGWQNVPDFRIHGGLTWRF